MRLAAVLALIFAPMLAFAQTEPPRGKADWRCAARTSHQRIAEFMTANDVPWARHGDRASTLHSALRWLWSCQPGAR